MIPSRMQRHPIPCPQCGEIAGLLEEEQAQEHLPEGLASSTLTSCAACGHDWQVVTHRQILQSMRRWSATSPPISS